MKKKIALVFGCTGQDGSYACEVLLKKNYRVFGLYRKSATGNFKNILHLIENKKIFNKDFFIIRGDINDYTSIRNAFNITKPHEVYNFADQDHVSWSFDIPIYSFSTTSMSVINILEIIKNTNKNIKYFQPLSSNMFGLSKEKKQNEKTKFNPTSLYAVSKVSTFYLCKMYREVFNLKVYAAIFFNHESPRRTAEYVTQKIVKHACEIKYNKRKKIELGDISAKIDWGYAEEYVENAWKIMQQKKPDTFVIATGKTTSVKDFLEKTFKYLNLDWKKYLKINKKLLRPSKTSILKGDISKAKKVFGYCPKVNIDKLIKIMVDHEISKYEKS